MRLPDLEAWAIFAKVASLGSFTQAAIETQLSKPTISKAVNRLEKSLGVALFNRNSRHISLTETGKKLLVHANRILQEAELAEVKAHENAQSLCGRIRMTVPVMFGTHYLAKMLPEFLERYPEIDLQIHFDDALSDLVAEGYDVALRIASLPDSALLARKLCDVRLLLVASEQFLKKVGQLSHPRDLESVRGFVYLNTDMPGVVPLHETHTGKKFSLTQKSYFSANNAEGFLPSLEKGLGYGVFPDFMVWERLQEGKLRQIFPTWQGKTLGVYLVSPPNAARPIRVTKLMDYIIEAFKSPFWTENKEK
ncbi:LysR family transcriptional regulator [Acetobacteraceae bacterium]|nr:LysR family transcriptional regulator [Acetobacteraceae bacterium]